MKNNPRQNPAKTTEKCNISGKYKLDKIKENPGQCRTINTMINKLVKY